MARKNKEDVKGLEFLVELIADESNVTKADAKTAVRIVSRGIKSALLKGFIVQITEFGTFTPRLTKGGKEFTLRNFKTGETTQGITKSNGSVGFKLSSVFKKDLTKSLSELKVQE